ncbi:hypothetical protein EDB84DRAFT_1437117 [Lactarius hengduanensis]|nr:hypothetical protein EDB84DRAFT_1437117 [Lactarius hengduanensis]
MTYRLSLCLEYSDHFCPHLLRTFKARMLMVAPSRTVSSGAPVNVSGKNNADGRRPERDDDAYTCPFLRWASRSMSSPAPSWRSCLPQPFVPDDGTSWMVSKNLKTCGRAVSGFAVNSDGRLTGDSNVATVPIPASGFALVFLASAALGAVLAVSPASTIRTERRHKAGGSRRT